MTQPALTVDAGLELFAKPKLQAFREALHQGWKDGFEDDVLAEELMANPRLETRIAQEICQRFDQPLNMTAPVKTDGKAIAAVMLYGVDKVAELAGCIWHRATVLDWMTWNNLDENLPDVDVDVLRACFRRVPMDLAQGCGAPSGATDGLSHHELKQSGLNCLTSWLHQCPPEITSRLMLFIDPQAKGHNQPGAEIIRSLAPCLVEEPA